MKQKTKTVEIDGTNYQIRRFAPAVGSFLLMRIIGAGLKNDGATDSVNGKEASSEPKGEVPGGEDLARAVIFAAFLRGLDFDMHQFVQECCMQVCARLEGADNLPMPLVNAGGVWAIHDVKEDMALVMRLEVEALVFNLSPFFEQGGLNSLAGQAPLKA